jgi:cyclopropane fatty-acyl-phospholipid synthase-like methyltransferase
MSADRYTSGQYLQNNPTWHVQDSAWKATQILRMIKKNQLSPASVCEVGCGAGEILVQLQQQMTANVTFSGYEVSTQAYQLCANRRRDRLQFHLSNLLDYTGDAFDLLLVIDVFEHVEDYFGFLRGLRDKATYKIFHIPLDMSVQKVLRKKPIMRLREGVGHIHYFMRETAVATLRDCGYEIMDIFYTAEDLELHPQSFLARIGIFPRRMLFFMNQDLAAHLLGGFSLMVLAR